MNPIFDVLAALCGLAIIGMILPVVIIPRAEAERIIREMTEGITAEDVLADMQLRREAEEFAEFWNGR